MSDTKAKTWEEIVPNKRTVNLCCEITAEHNGYYSDWKLSDTCDGSTIGLHALAAMKIYQLIENSYGGVVSAKEQLENGCATIVVDEHDFYAFWQSVTYTPSIIAFHTEQQAEEFLKYDKNRQLVKDYYMLH